MRDWPRVSRRALLASAALLVPRIAGAADLEWKPGIAAPRGRSETAAGVVDGKIYLAGGFVEGLAVDCFDPATNTWSTIADLPDAVHHPGVAALDGGLYVAGGYEAAGHTAVAKAHRYDPAGDTWTRIADLPTAKGAFGLVGLDGKLWAVGGATAHLGGPAIGEVAIYDPGRDHWSVTDEPVPTPREHLAVVARDARIYTIGGRANGDNSDRFAARVERFDFATGTWSQLPDLPIPRSGMAGVATADSIVVLGGEREGELFDDANRFDLATESWSSLPPMPTARHGLMAAWMDGTLYAFAGSVVAGQVDNVTTVETLKLP